MNLRYRLVTSFATLCLALTMSPALAAKRSPSATAVPEGSKPVVIGMPSALPPPACTPGQLSAVLLYGPWFLPPEDRYYTFIDPEACGCQYGLNLTSAHWDLWWTAACEIPIEITLVAAVETSQGSGCWIPDDNQPLGAPVSATLSSSALLQVVDHAFPLDWPCLNQKAFISFSLLTNGDCPVDVPTQTLESPRALSDDTPDACVSYNTYPGSAGPLDMVDPSYNFGGNLTMWVTGDCCTLEMPTFQRSWGKVKTLYR